MYLSFRRSFDTVSCATLIGCEQEARDDVRILVKGDDSSKRDCFGVVGQGVCQTITFK